MFSLTRCPYSAVKLNANALLPPGVFLLLSTPASCPMLLLRAILKMFSEGSVFGIGVVLHCLEIDWLIMLSCKAKEKKKNSSTEPCTAKLIPSSKSQEQYIIHAFPCTVNRIKNSIEFAETSCTSTERILGVLSVSVAQPEWP